jgi:hypothetical protein
MAAQGVDSIKALEAHFERRVLALAAAAGRSYIVWQVLVECISALSAPPLCHGACSRAVPMSVLVRAHGWDQKRIR